MAIFMHTQSVFSIHFGAHYYHQSSAIYAWILKIYSQLFAAAAVCALRSLERLTTVLFCCEILV